MIYSFFNSIIKGYLKFRHGRIEKMYADPLSLQYEQLDFFISQLKKTEYGRKFKATNIQSYHDFSNALPVTDYESLAPYLEKMMLGGKDILWPDKILWFAKSSGTTNDKSKYIPISDHNLFENHVSATWDAMSILYEIRPDSKIFDRKNLVLGGSLTAFAPNPEVTVGDVSAILLHRMPAVGRPFYAPDFETALLADWEEKIERTANICIHEDIGMFAGVPTWTIVLFRKILDKTGKKNMLEVWPNLKAYLHGGVSFEPYREQFKELIPTDDFQYLEVYNASEGYFAVQDTYENEGMLMLLDNAVFYEFIPMDQFYAGERKAIPIWEVELDKTYCLVITTASGLWRYMPGDTVIFTSLKPYRIRIAGRTKHFINAFGEEVMVSNTDQALKLTCEAMHVQVSDYTVAPVFLDQQGKGGHQWLIEFQKKPDDIKSFELMLDDQLKMLNSDYEAKRFKDIALQNLVITELPQGTFQSWLKHKGRYSAQSKVPRLSNDRNTVDQILAYVSSNK